MIHFYLNEQEIHVEANASFTETKDQSLDSGSFSLPIGSIRNPIAPMTPFRVYNDVTEESMYFVVIVDSVEVVSKKPPLYKHTLTITQSSRRLCKHRLRNSVFNQPTIMTLKSPCNFMGAMRVILNSDSDLVYENEYVRPFSSGQAHNNMTYSSPIVISPRSRIKSIKIHFDAKVLKYKTEAGGVYENPESWIDFNQFYNFVIKVIKKQNGVFTDALLFDMQGTEYEFTTPSEIAFFTNRDENTTFEILPYNDAVSQQVQITVRDVADLPTPEAPNFSTIFLFTGNLIVDTYNYTLLDVLKTINKQAKRECIIGGSHYADTNFIVPDDEFLDSIVAPDFNFTGMDLFEAVSEIFRFIDAVPTLTDDIDFEEEEPYIYAHTIGYEFLNDNNGEVIENIKMADFKRSLSEEYYANKLMTVYQNCKQERAKFEPSSKSFMMTSSKTLGIVTRQSSVIALKEPIDYIDNLWCFLGFGLKFTIAPYVLYDAGSVATIVEYRDMPKPFIDDGIDISPALFEKSIYSLLEARGQEVSFPNQMNTIFYEKGAKDIDLGDIVNQYGTMFNTTNIQWAVRMSVACALGFLHGTKPYAGTEKLTIYTQDGEQADVNNTNFKIYAKWRVKYHGVYNGQVATVSNEQRYDGEQMISQSNSGAELSRLGINMFGMVNKLGNEMFNVTMPLTSFNDRIRKGQWFIDTNGNRYTANLVKTTIGTNEKNCMQSIQFVKNYNELSQFIRLNKENRMYEIDTNITETGYENLVEYLELSTTPSTGYDDPTVVSTFSGLPEVFDEKCTMLDAIFAGTLLSDKNYAKYQQKADYCIIEVFDNENDNESMDLGLINKANSGKGIYCPMHSYGFGNTLCFEIGYNHPIDAGTRQSILNVSGMDIVRAQTTLYTNREGYFDKANIYFCWDNTYRSLVDYPLTDVPSNDRVIGKINEYKYFKKPNEIFHLNYQIAFVSPKSDIFIGENFIKENAVIRNSSDSEGTDKTIKIYYSNSYLYSIIDKKGQGTVANSGSIAFESHADYSNNQINKLDINIYFGSTVQFKSFAICNQNDNILIAGNKTGNSDHATIYVYPRHSRKEE